MERKKAVYISGPITGVKNYWEAFEQAEEDLQGLGYIPLSPAHLPEGLTKEQYMRIDLAMIDAADAVLSLSFLNQSPGGQLELDYCRYTGKPVVFSRNYNDFGTKMNPREIVQAWLKHDLEEVFKK